MIDRTAHRFDLRPERLAGDRAYGSAEMLNWLVEERQIAPHIPVIDKSVRRDGTFARGDYYHSPSLFSRLATILSAPSRNGRCSFSASGAGAVIQRSISSAVVRMAGLSEGVS